MKETTIALVSAVLFPACASTYSELDRQQEALLTPATPSVEHPDQADLWVQRAVVVDVDAECAYQVVADIARWTSWDSSLKEARLVSGSAADPSPVDRGTVFFQDFGDFQARAVVIEAEPGRRLRWRGQDPGGSGPVGVHTWTFVSQDDGQTLVLNDEHFHCWYMRPVGWFTDLGIGEQFDLTLSQFAAEATRRCSRP